MSIPDSEAQRSVHLFVFDIKLQLSLLKYVKDVIQTIDAASACHLVEYGLAIHIL